MFSENGAKVFMHVYWFQDSKIGHLNQVQALLDELSKENELVITKIHCTERSVFNWLKSFLPSAPIQNQQDGLTLLIGAGHSTYPQILQTQKSLKQTSSLLSVAILKPSFNTNDFDLICAPEHDYPSTEKPNNVHLFKGSLATTSLIEPTLNKGIIGLGGSSKHYDFDSELVVKQIEYVLTTHPHYHFHIYSSRRTPSSLNQAIKNMSKEFQNFSFIDMESPKAKSFKEDLQTSELKFVTPDSSNLVFEALSCKGKTYVIQIERLVRSKTYGSKKIRNAINALVANHQVGTLTINTPTQGLKVHAMEHPVVGLEPLAEVEKTAYVIQGLINNKI
ncbi:mitochondrial fission ELM1 family protein [Gammaproteobacteria bacterium]|nr:mitochondrial fission ELM1 family protein [Gammaproteobacteria bacterium]MDB4243685.1 mitochondrial fission ELM1 family protein [Gammaproteobacteria bacterium]MDC0091084.1 mitochondrial fission ELM1 family protein [Gammaproteobacteria bacterium]